MRTKPIMLMIAVLLLPASVTRAQSWDEPGMRLRLQTPTSLTKRHKPKDPATAALISAAATLGSWAAGMALIVSGEDSAWPGVALLGFGVTFGPSMGHYYAGESGRGTTHGLIRSGLYLGGGTLLMVGLLQSLDFDGAHTGESDGEVLAWMGLAALAAAGIHAIYGIIDSAFAAKRANRRAGARALAIAPMVSKSAAGETQYGVALAGRF